MSGRRVKCHAFATGRNRSQPYATLQTTMEPAPWPENKSRNLTPAPYPPLLGDSLPLGPTSCGPTPSSGGLPRNAPGRQDHAWREIDSSPVARASPRFRPQTPSRRIHPDRDLRPERRKSLRRADYLRDPLTAGPEPPGEPPPIGGPCGAEAPHEAAMRLPTAKGCPRQSAREGLPHLPLPPL